MSILGTEINHWASGAPGFMRNGRRFGKLQSSRERRRFSLVVVAAAYRYLIHFFAPHTYFKTLNRIRITLERDGKSSELQVEEGDNILQVRRLSFVFKFRAEGKASKRASRVFGLPFENFTKKNSKTFNTSPTKLPLLRPPSTLASSSRTTARWACA